MQLQLKFAITLVIKKKNPSAIDMVKKYVKHSECYVCLHKFHLQEISAKGQKTLPH